MRLHDAEANPRVGLDLLLKVLGERFVAFRRDDRERIDVKAAQAFACWLTHRRRPRPMVCRRSRSVRTSRSAQIWKTLGLSQPSRKAECEKMNLSGVSRLKSFSFSFMIRL